MQLNGRRHNVLPRERRSGRTIYDCFAAANICCLQKEINMALWVMIAVLYGDAAMSQEFFSKETCEAAGAKMRKVKGNGFTFICSEK